MNGNMIWMYSTEITFLLGKLYEDFGKTAVNFKDLQMNS